MSDLRELYQELILDHHKRPRNFGKLLHGAHHAEGYNPLCGDRTTVYLRLRDGVVEDVRFEGTGCAISTASASLMSEAIKGKTIDQVRVLANRIHQLIVAEESTDTEGLGKLAVLAGVRQFPTRVKCATLAWHTLTAALDDDPKTVSTE